MLSGKDGALLIGEANYIDRGTKIGVGAWGYTARFDTLDPPDGPASGRGNEGAYAFVEHRLIGNRSDPPRGLAGWLRIGVADPRYNPVARYLGGGLVYSGVFRERPDDQIGLSIADAEFGDRYRRSQTLAGRPTRPRELVVEAAYQASLARWLSIEPDLQYVARPSGDEKLRNALVDHLDLAIVRGADGVHQTVPHTGLPPSVEAVVGGGARTIAFRQVAPRRPGTQYPEDAVQHATVVYAGHASGLVGQQRLDHAPLEVGQIISAHAEPESHARPGGKLNRTHSY